MLRTALHAAFPQGAADASIPAMDGPWTPNDDLEVGASVVHRDGLRDALPWGHEKIALLHGSTVSVVDRSGRGEVVAELPSRGTSFDIQGDQMAVACEGHGIVIVRAGAVSDVLISDDTPTARCVTAVALRGDQLHYTCGSTALRADQWKRGLLTADTTGLVGMIGTDGSAPSVVADGLSWPDGIAVTDDALLVSEAGGHRVVRVSSNGVETWLDRAPAHPGRITSDGSGGWLIAFPTPRSALVELVMGERRFLDRMLSLDERAWVGPTWTPLDHPVEQVQGGQLLVFGQIKPWAPSRSSGLAVAVDGDGSVTRTWQSRADGQRHGIVRTFLHDGHLWAVSAATDELIRLGAWESR